MLPLLKTPGFEERAMPLSVAAWHEMIRSNLTPARAELLRGVIVEKMPKSILHIKLAARMLRILMTSLVSGWWVRQEAPLTLADSEPEPDLSVVAGDEGDYQNHPTTAALVVEVSVSTLAEDRALATIYAEAGVQEYWIINASAHCIEVYQAPKEGRFTETEVIERGAALESIALPGLVIDTATLFADLPTQG